MIRYHVVVACGARCSKASTNTNARAALHVGAAGATLSASGILGCRLEPLWMRRANPIRSFGLAFLRFSRWFSLFAVRLKVSPWATLPLDTGVVADWNRGELGRLDATKVRSEAGTQNSRLFPAHGLASFMCCTYVNQNGAACKSGSCVV